MATIDLDFDFGTFDSTTVRVTATSRRGLDFLAGRLGAGAVSFEVRKSGSQGVYDAAVAAGLTCQ